MFCAMAEEAIGPVQPLEDYVQQARHPAARPMPRAGSCSTASASSCATARPTRFKPRVINRFLRSLSPEHQLTLLTDLVEQWGALGADRAMFDLLQEGHGGMSGASTSDTATQHARPHPEGRCGW